MGENKNKPRVIIKDDTELEEKTVAEEEKTVKKEEKKAEKPKKKVIDKTAQRKKEPDPRGRIVCGIFTLLLGCYILISFVGFVTKYELTGKIGESIGQFLSREMFGLGSLFIIFLVFHFGSNLTFGGPKIKHWTIWKYMLMSLVWLPLLLALIFKNIKPAGEGSFDFVYGNVGDVMHTFLEPYISNAGIIIILVFGAAAYVFYTFDINISELFSRDPEHEEPETANSLVAQDDIYETPQKTRFNGNRKIEDKDEINEDEEEDEIDDDDDDDDDSIGNITLVNKNEKKKEEEEKTSPLEIELTGDFEEEVKTEGDERIAKEEAEDEQEEPQNVTELKINTVSGNVKKEAEEKRTASDVPIDVKIEVEETKKDEIHSIKYGEHIGLDTPLDPRSELSDFKFPPIDFLNDYDDDIEINKDELEANKNKIVSTLANYSINIDKIKATIGPTVTLYEIVPEAGTRISKIKGLQDDIAMCLSALGIRIIAPIPGKGTIGIEVPNLKPKTVSMRSVIASEKFQKCGFALPFGIGKTISNETYVADLAKMPHILMAGATGQGKSVGLNAIIASLLYSKHPSELKFVFIDPKKVELSLYKKIERHYLAKLPDAPEAIITDVKQVVRTLNSLCIEMDTRYDLLKDAEVKNIKEYNAKFAKHLLNPEQGHHFMPYIVLVVDEFADLIMTAGREVEAPIARLAQLARAIGIHLIIATQRPSVKIITGNIKNNFPARIAFRVISRVDSGTILDSNGAEQLVGRGDMLMSTGQDLVRLQCPFIDTPEIEKITDFIGAQRGFPDAFMLPEVPDDTGEGGGGEDVNPEERDPLFEEAARIMVQTQQGSTSLLQRKMKIGFARAGRIIDQLEKAGVLGPFAGSKPREVKIANEFALDQFLKDLNYENEDENEY